MTGKMDTIIKIGEKTRTHSDKEKMENNCDSKISAAKNSDKIKEKSPTTTNERVVKTQRKKRHTPVEN